MKKIVEIYEDLNKACELDNESDIREYEEAKEKLRRYEFDDAYYEKYRVEICNLKTKKVIQVGGKEGWEDEMAELEDKDEEISESEDREEER